MSTNQRLWPDSGQILRHQYGISVAESFLRAKRPHRRRARRKGCFRRLSYQAFSNSQAPSTRMHPFLFENGDQFLQFGPPSKSLRWKGSPKMHLFKNALQRGNFMTTEVFEKDYAKVLDTSKRACSHQRWYRFQWLLRFFADRQKQFKKFFGTSVKVNLISS